MDNEKWQKILEHVEGGLSRKNPVTIRYGEFLAIGAEFTIAELRAAIDENATGFRLSETGANTLTFTKGTGEQ